MQEPSQDQARAERDAAVFLNTLFRGKPDELLIGIGPANHQAFVETTERASRYVVGKRDVFVRTTAVRERPKGGRGDAKASAWLPGVWTDVDIIGSPDGRGGVKETGARDIAHAKQLLYCVTQPTMAVHSGYGVHGYWLLDEPLLIDTDAAWQRADRLVKGWQRRMAREAEALGITGLDPVGDLARIMRVPGSLNCKGEAPAPVGLT